MSSLDSVRKLDGLIEQERKYICALSSRLAKSYKMEKEDAEQEAFLAAWRSIQTFDGRSTVKTFITRSIVNHFINLHRKSRVENDSCVQLDAFDDADDIAEATEFANVKGPEDTLEGLQMLELFYTKLEEMEEDVRQIVEARVLNDSTYAEIAKELRQPLVNVRVKMHRALKALRRDLLGT